MAMPMSIAMKAVAMRSVAIGGSTVAVTVGSVALELPRGVVAGGVGHELEPEPKQPAALGRCPDRGQLLA